MEKLKLMTHRRHVNTAVREKRAPRGRRDHGGGERMIHSAIAMTSVMHDGGAAPAGPSEVRVRASGEGWSHLFVGENTKKLLASGMGGVWLGMLSSETRRGRAVTRAPSSSDRPASSPNKHINAGRVVRPSAGGS
ncbi:hypothetical protein EVAR_77398_1 [Eumeta japonica]|uniref:Uncharacterized protein n=1 Tax=Eumeta variegata TaxID=151549 RepID=A0A4C1UYR3_EUMVA|nr:hypothetical protein EVAR_77398_1 [Eumeta japonica]